MYKILIDDNFYQNTSEQNVYLKKLLDVITKFFDAKIVLFEPFGHRKKTPQLYMRSQSVNRDIFLTHIAEKFDLSKVTDDSNSLLETMGFNRTFIGKINFIKKSYPEAIIIIPLCYNKNNITLKIKKHYDYLFYIGNYGGELNSNIAMWIQKNQLIRMNNPCKNNIFPGYDFCYEYDNIRSSILKSFVSGTKLSDFEAIGTEVAFRNHYTYDSGLTSLNKMKAKRDKNGNPPKRKVFKSNGKETFYLSIDFENGGFEVYDKSACHKGQYKFSGEFEKDADSKSHPLYLK